MSFYLTDKSIFQINKSVKSSLPDPIRTRTELPFPEGSMRKLDKRTAFPTSLIFGESKKKLRRGSLTPEAAWVIPLFFLLLISLMGLMDVYGIYVENMVELQVEAEKLGMYAAGTTAIADISDERSGGFESSVIEKNSTETYHPLWLPFPFDGIKIHVRARVRPWTGKSGEEIAAGASSGSHSMAYVTEWGEVYHTTSLCSHLSLSIHQVSASQVGNRRNADGKRYQPCEKCVGKGGKNSLVYIADQGDCYHNSLECSGLKRSVMLKEISELDGMPCCSRCKELEAAS